jgi:phosphoribosylamine--glycine ligase
MRVLIVGNGGREHALAWALSASPLLSALFVAPGNPGTAAIGTNVAIGALDVAALVDFAVAERIDLVVPGPEAPLVAGLADALARAGVKCFGPSAAAAMLEGSKAFAKEIADAAGIPTAAWERFEDSQAALDFVARRGAPIVVKADGLAAGKGVTVAATEAEAAAAIRDAMIGGTLGEAGASVVIEECLTGDEVSLFALCDGEDAVLLGAAQDHKRVGDGDTGPNTGGMGAVSPPSGFGLEAQMAAMDVFVRPALAEMARRGTPFRGVLFAGLMLTADGPKLIEYNVRFGDPEAQTLLPRLRSDLLTGMVAACDGELGAFTVVLDPVACVCVVLAARGYPGGYAKGGAIGGLDVAAGLAHVAVFHGGTDVKDGAVVAAGGRVLTVCATGADLASARASAYAGVAAIEWEDKMFRTDIGLRAQRRAAELGGAA